MSVLAAYKLSKSYSVQEVFRDVSLQLSAGDHVALVGPNGAGKTTLLKILAGLESPDAGSVAVARGRRVGYLPQEATLTSGLTLYAEALTAFAHLQDMQAELHRLEQAMAQASQTGQDGDPAEGRNLADLLEQYATLSASFERAGGYTYESETARVLGGLGFAVADFATLVEHLSGGQKTRAALAKLLLAAPDVLLLDEPTNHLDLAATEWLEDYLVHWKGSLVVVAHDRRLLDAVAGKVWELAFGRLEEYPGNYTTYTQLRAERLERRRTEYATQQAFIAKTEDFIRRYGAGQRSKEARGREKRLARLERLARPQDIASLRLRFDLTTGLRSGDIVLATKGLVIGYQRESPLFTIPDLVVRRGERVALLGPNGCGKTTFLKTILGEVPPLPPSGLPHTQGRGEVRLGASLQPGYYAQTHEGLNLEATVLDEVFDLLPNLERARTFLGRFLFSGDDVYKRVGDLSGGERSRVALARLTLERANFLLLDEPTNHLDILSQEVLEDVLGDFNGTLLFVSHDRYFIDALATQLWVVEDGRLVVHAGNYTDYLEEKQAGERSTFQVPGRARPPVSGSSTLSGKREVASAQPAASRKRQISRDRQPPPASAARQIAALEEEITALEDRLDDLSQAIGQASMAQDVAKVRELGEEYAAVEEQLGRSLAAWEKAAG
jgi:ATP-binding cassette subfamily F protein 3